jgi:hypothetical protein
VNAMAAIVQVMDSVNWSVVNTTLLLAALGFMWRQSQGVSELKQIMFGAKGAKGLLARVEVMEAASDLRAEQAGASPAGREILAQFARLTERVIELEQNNRSRRTRETDGDTKT